MPKPKPNTRLYQAWYIGIAETDVTIVWTAFGGRSSSVPVADVDTR